MVVFKGAFINAYEEVFEVLFLHYSTLNK